MVYRRTITAGAYHSWKHSTHRPYQFTIYSSWPFETTHNTKVMERKKKKEKRQNENNKNNTIEFPHKPRYL